VTIRATVLLYRCTNIGQIHSTHRLARN